MKLTVVGAGEALLRLQKRLGCAAAELGFTAAAGTQLSGVWRRR